MASRATRARTRLRFRAWPPLRTVLFDLDGTLIDSVRLILDSYHHTLAAHGLPAAHGRGMAPRRGNAPPVQFAEWRTTRARSRRWSRPIASTTSPTTTAW